MTGLVQLQPLSTPVATEQLAAPRKLSVPDANVTVRSAPSVRPAPAPEARPTAHLETARNSQVPHAAVDFSHAARPKPGPSQPPPTGVDLYAKLQGSVTDSAAKPPPTAAENPPADAAASQNSESQTTASSPPDQNLGSQTPADEAPTDAGGSDQVAQAAAQTDTSPVIGNPQATIAKADSLQMATLAPPNPSLDDARLYTKAQALRENAQAELRQKAQATAAAEQAPKDDFRATRSGDLLARTYSPGTVAANTGDLVALQV